MPGNSQVLTPESFKTFGDLLRHLRIRAGLSQRDLAARVNYHYAHLNRIEKNQRMPNRAVLLARFIPALMLDDQPEWAARLIDLASESPVETLQNDIKPNPDQHRYFVPANLVDMLGRTDETARLTNYLLSSETHLLTLVGPPGVGKTSLALHVAGKVERHFKSGAIFVDLSPVMDDEMVLDAISSALGLQENASNQKLAVLQAFFRDKNLLMVLDNFEQVMEASPQIARLLAAAPELKILITSRESLRIQGEREFPILPLPAPETNEFEYNGLLDSFPAIRLFVQRADSVQPGFSLTPQNASLIAEICRRLDGLPLAIEFAAARIQTMSLEEMVSQLDRRFDWLTRGRRDFAGWRGTLRGVLEWSYTLLSDQESALFNRLSVFSGGWTLEAAREVCCDDLLCVRSDIFSLLSVLADKSLLVAERRGKTTRYRFLDTVLHFAKEKLKESGEEDEYRNRHMQYYVGWAEILDQAFDRRPEPDFNQRIGDEQNNLRIALDWAWHQKPEHEISLRFIVAVSRLWFETNHFTEGIEWAERFLPYTENNRHVRLRGYLLYRLATLINFAFWADKKEQVSTLFEEAIQLARKINDVRLIAAILYWCRFLHTDAQNNKKARTYLEECIPVFRVTESFSMLSHALADLGTVLHRLGDASESRASLDEAIRVAVEQQDVHSEAYALRMLAEVLRYSGQYHEALSVNQRALELALRLGDRLNCGQALVQMAVLANILGNYAESGLFAQQSYEFFNSIGSEFQQPFPERLQGYAALHVGQLNESRRLCLDSLRRNLALGMEHRVGVLAGLILLAELEQRAQNSKLAVRILFIVLREKERLAIKFQEPDEIALARLQSSVFLDANGVTLAVGFDEFIQELGLN